MNVIQPHINRVTNCLDAYTEACGLNPHLNMFLVHNIDCFLTLVCFWYSSLTLSTILSRSFIVLPLELSRLLVENSINYKWHDCGKPAHLHWVIPVQGFPPRRLKFHTFTEQSVKNPGLGLKLHIFLTCNIQWALLTIVKTKIRRLITLISSWEFAVKMYFLHSRACSC